MKLEQLEPQKVFYYFEEISKIPHGSYDTKRISDYCREFAQEHQLFYIQDKWNNIVIVKEASKGYEDAAAVMIQGHLDMVCEKAPGSSHDFKKDALDLVIEGDFIRAKETTLGGDDGIAVAYALAVLADPELKHPRLEVVLTAEEEVGMDGAKGLDTSMLRAKRMLNIDSEEEGILLTSCAGGFRGNCLIPVSRVEKTGIKCQIKITGLQGGHSGMEIVKGRANANKLMGRFLDQLTQAAEFGLTALAGGLKDNAIPKEAAVEFIIAADHAATVEAQVRQYETVLQKEYQQKDPDVKIACQIGGQETGAAVCGKDLEKIIFFLLQVPDGVQTMSGAIQGLVQTSLNLGVLQLKEQQLCASFAVRSSLQSEKEALGRQLASFMEYVGGSYEMHGDYPAWEYQPDSELREIMVRVYQEQYHTEPKVEAVHAGLECGILSDKIKGIDCVSFGPDIFDVHTIDERLSISSTRRVWHYLLAVLEQL